MIIPRAFSVDGSIISMPIGLRFFLVGGFFDFATFFLMHYRAHVSRICRRQRATAGDK